jgi:hypothetical protein
MVALGHPFVLPILGKLHLLHGIEVFLVYLIMKLPSTSWLSKSEITSYMPRFHFQVRSWARVSYAREYGFCKNWFSGHLIASLQDQGVMFWSTGMSSRCWDHHEQGGACNSLIVGFRLEHEALVFWSEAWACYSLIVGFTIERAYFTCLFEGFL